MNRWFFALVCLVTIVLGYAWNFQGNLAKEFQILKSQEKDKALILHTFQIAQRHLKKRPKMIQTLERSRLLEPTSLESIRSEIVSLGYGFGLLRIEMETQEETTYANPYPKPIISDRLHLKIKSPFDRNTFQFMEALQEKAPGIIAYRDLSLERVDTGDIPFIEGTITLTWYHTPKINER